MSCDDTCQCGGQGGEPIITMRFTRTQADQLWATLQGRAEGITEGLEKFYRGEARLEFNFVADAEDEHKAVQELADIVYAHTYDEAGEFREPEPAPVVEMVLPPIFTELATELVTLSESLTRMVGVMADYFEGASGGE